MKGTAHALGYFIGIVVVIPLIMWVANTFILTGNDANDNEINEFIGNCYIDTVTIPKFLGRYEDMGTYSIHGKTIKRKFIRIYVFL